VDLVEPSRHRGLRESPGDGAVPALLCQPEVLDLVVKELGQQLPCDGTPVDASLPAVVEAVEAEPAAQDANGTQTQLAREVHERRLIAVYQIGACFGVLTRRKLVTHRPDPAADAVARLDHGHRSAACLEFARGAQPRQPGARHDYLHAAQTDAVHD
jgi:hypothetical protein